MAPTKPFEQLAVVAAPLTQWLEARPRLRGYLAFALPFAGLALAFTLFSLYTVLMKKALSDGTSALVLAFMREIIAVAVFMPSAFAIEYAYGTPAAFWPQQEDHLSFLALGFAMVWGVQLLSALSLEHLSANTYALLAPSVPVLTAGLAIASGYERFDVRSRISWMKIAAIGIAVLGAVWIAVGAYVSSPSKEKGSVVIGLFLLCGNKVCVATYPIMEKRLMARYRPSTIVAWGYVTGAVLILLSVFPCALHPELWHISSSGWTSILFSGLVTSGFNYALMAEINKVRFGGAQEEHVFPAT